MCTAQHVPLTYLRWVAWQARGGVGVLQGHREQATSNGAEQRIHFPHLYVAFLCCVHVCPSNHRLMHSVVDFADEKLLLYVSSSLSSARRDSSHVLTRRSVWIPSQAGTCSHTPEPEVGGGARREQIEIINGSSKTPNLDNRTRSSRAHQQHASQWTTCTTCTPVLGSHTAAPGLSGLVAPLLALRAVVVCKVKRLARTMFRHDCNSTMRFGEIKDKFLLSSGGTFKPNFSLTDAPENWWRTSRFGSSQRFVDVDKDKVRF